MTVRQAVKYYPCLQVLAKAKTTKQRKKILASSPKCIYNVLVDISKQILSGTVPVNSKHKLKLRRYKNVFRKLAGKVSSRDKKHIINQAGGFLPLLIKPALTILATLAANQLMK